MDFKLEFGRHHGKILLGDEICPDTCRFWDKATRKKLDKDRFRRDLGGVEEAYQEMLRRVETDSKFPLPRPSLRGRTLGEVDAEHALHVSRRVRVLRMPRTPRGTPLRCR